MNGTTLFGTLIIPNKTGTSQLEYPIEKKSVLMGRDKSCDIRLVNKEVSRRHVELYVDENGDVCLVSMGREPVRLNGEQVLSPTVLKSGDKIEVQLEGRTREFYFKSGRDETKSISDPNVPQTAALQEQCDAPQVSVLPNVAEEEPVLEMRHEPQKMFDDERKRSILLEQVPLKGDEEQGVDEVMADEQMGDTEQDVTRPETEEAAVMKTEVSNRMYQKSDDIAAIEKDGNAKIDGNDCIIDAAVSKMVQEMFVRVIQATEAAVTAFATPSKNQKQKRKSVRFYQSSTPEGAPHDAPMTIRCRPREGEQTVLVEDDTVAFAEWGFATMKDDADDEEAKVDTVLSKHSRHESIMQQATPASVRRASLKSKGSPYISNQLDFSQHEHGHTPAAGIGAQAPASIPVTAAKPTPPPISKKLDLESLTRKLGEIAEEHDIQFELPKDFMRFTPMSTAKRPQQETIDQDKKEEDDRSIEFDLPKDFMKFTPTTIKGKKRAMSCDTNPDYDLPKDFMKFTPIGTSAKKNPQSAKKQSSSTDGMAFDLPQDFMKFTPMTVASKRHMDSSDKAEYELPKDFMRFTPLTEPKRVRESSECMELELPTDFMRFTPIGGKPEGKESHLKSAIKSLGRAMDVSTMGKIEDMPGDIQGEVATLRSVGHAVQGLADALEAAASAKKESVKKTPGVRIAIVEKTTGATATPHMKVLFEDATVEDQEMEVVDTQNDQEQKTGNHEVKKLSSHHHKKKNPWMLHAQSYRAQALVLGKHLKRSSLRVSRMKRVASILSNKYKAEKAKRLELQNALQQLIQNRENDEATLDEEMDDVEDMDSTADTNSARVVVVGYEEPDRVSNVEIAGRVVVVRPHDPPARTPAKTPKTVKRFSNSQSVKKSLRRVSGSQIVLDDVKVPNWIFDEEVEANNEDGQLSDHDEHEEVLEKLESTLRNEDANAVNTTEEEEEEEEDICHVCQTGNEGDVLLLCDSCDNACHLACCDPPRKRVPKGDWYCRDCTGKKKKEAGKSAPIPKASGTKRKAENSSKPDAKKNKATATKKKAVTQTTKQTGTRRTRSKRT
eukprot:jgi/Picsp_1/6448/NSC_03795-R1_bromodomain adjacent to zinc finger domain protein 2a